MSYVVSNGVTSNGIVLNGSDMIVSSGGTANNTTVNSGGKLYLSSGGTATGIVENGGYVNVLDGANAAFVPNTFSDLVLSKTSATVHSGTTANNTLLRGEIVSATMQFSWGDYPYVYYNSGCLAVFSGGTANNTAVSYLGYLIVSSGGTVNRTTVNSGGNLYVSSGGTVNRTTVNSGGNLCVSSGGTATIDFNPWQGNIASNDGAEITYLGRDANVYYGSGGELISKADVMESETIGSGYSTILYSGGIANNTIVSGGSFFVFSGGAANYVSVFGGGEIRSVFDYYTSVISRVSSTIASFPNGRLIVSGGVANDIVMSGGYVDVLSGGVLNRATIHQYGLNPSSVIPDFISRPYSYNAGLTLASFTVFSGGAANDITIDGGRLVVSDGGTISKIAFSSQGSLIVSSGGTAIDVDWTPFGGTVIIEDGASVTFIEKSGVYYGSGNRLLSHEQKTELQTVTNSASMYVLSDGLAKDTKLDNKGALFVWNGGVANNTTVSSGGNLTVSSGGIANNTRVSSGGNLTAASSGTANSAVVDVGGSFLVSSGGTANNVSVFGGGEVRSWGKVYLGSISSSNGWVPIANIPDGHLVVSGGVANDIVMSGGVVDVMRGGVLNGATIYYSGFISGYNETYYDSDYPIERYYDKRYRMATFTVFGGGTANNVTISGGNLVVSFCGVANSATVNSGGNLNISSGGTANNVTVNSGGYLLVSSGGTATDIDWTPCLGNVTIKEGAQATFTSQYSGVYYGSDNQLLSHAQCIDSVTLNNASMYVMAGGTANSATVNPNGRLYVSSGGTASISFNPWGGDIVSNIGADLTYLERDANVYYGGLNAGLVSKADVMDSLKIGSGYSAIIYSDGAANNISAHTDGRLYVSSGGTATGVSVSGGILTVSSGGTVNNVTVEDMLYFDFSRVVPGLYDYRLFDGIVFVSGGTVNSSFINSSGTMHVSSGGMANDTTVNSGGTMYVYGGGIAIDATIDNGHMYIYSGGKLNGQMTIASGAIVSAYAESILGFDISALAPGATARINDLSLISGWSNALFTLTVDGEQADGTYKLADGAAGFNKTISVVNTSGSQLGTLSVGQTTAIGGVNYSLSLANGLLSVTRGGSASSGTGTSIVSDTRVIFAGQTSSGLTVTSSGKLYVSSGGTANCTTVNSYGSMFVYSGGTANNTTLHSGGDVWVYSGGTATDLVWTPCEGHAYVLDGGYATFVSQYSGVYYGSDKHLLSNAAVMDGMNINSISEMNVMNGGTANSATINDHGSMFVFSGGIANSTTVNSNGYLYVSSGGTANRIMVNSGGELDVYSGGTANYTTLNSGDELDVNSGGDMWVMHGGTANYTTVYSGGFLCVSSGGTANCTTVNSGGSIRIADDGTANDTTVFSGGNLNISSGGKLTGRTTFSNEAVVSAISGAIIDFDLTRTSTGAAALVNDLSIVQGAPLFTLTVDGEQADGTYKLADGASGFGSTISVVSTSGTQLGSLSVGQTASIIGNAYSLNLSGGTLSVTVAVGAGGDTPAPEPEPDPVEVRKLPTFTGDFAGNGKSILAVKDENLVSIYRNKGVVWSELTLDDGWDVAGVGDFDGDGADDILRVHSSGLVIGEMSDGYGEFTPQVLNFRSEGWSILGTGDFNHNGKDDVLIANPTGASQTVGLLGYWESGVTWTLINGYSAEWEMVSTGDFNGDGKCDMLWRNSFVGNGGLTYNAYCTWIVDPPAGQSDWRMVSVANPFEWNFLCSGDFDGNGSHDIAMINDVGVVGIWGVTDGYLSSWSILSAVDPSVWALAGVGDFNGDGTDDIAWGNTETGLTGYWQINDKNLTAWQNIAVLA